MSNFWLVLILLALGAVVVTLFAGMATLFVGGDFARRYSNKLMRLRVMFQALAVALLLLAFLSSA